MKYSQGNSDKDPYGSEPNATASFDLFIFSPQSIYTIVLILNVKERMQSIYYTVQLFSSLSTLLEIFLSYTGND